MDPSSLEPILAYLRENSGRYDSATLRESLLRAGHPPDEIDRAMTSFPTLESPAGPGSRPLSASTIFVLNLLVLVLFERSLPNPLPSLGVHGLSHPLFPAFTFVLTGLETFLGLALMRSPSNRRWSRGLLIGGGVLFLPLAAFAWFLMVVKGIFR